VFFNQNFHFLGVPLRKKLRVGFYVPAFFYHAKKRDKKRAPLQPLTQATAENELSLTYEL
jgi:hypothetical protein